MDVKTTFFDIISEVGKDLEDVSTGIGKFVKNLIYKNFVRNVTSKLARSTLTSPGRIRVNTKPDGFVKEHSRPAGGYI
jgi:hypothetical protein